MSQNQASHKFLVYVVTYEAEQHLFDLFERIPYELFNRSGFHFLVSDDASSDNGPVVLKEWLEAHEIHNVTILKNRVNQGYGGNQKIGFRVAVDNGYSCLILLHGDGQYSPELLPEFARVWSESEPDVILGSRMHSVKSAREGGMPYYKLLGNRILTTYQNRMTGWELSEYHTGYRAYATKFLANVPFEINTNDFHFDTEILLQAAHVNARVEEINIPTFYGDEVCRVSGFKYAWNVFTATMQYKMHQLGMLCSLKLRNLSTGRYRDKTQAGYSSHALALQLLKQREAKRVLDIGCGPGHIAARCEQAGMQVTGIDCAAPLPGSMTDFHIANLEVDELPVSISNYDNVLLMDVIEHLADPEAFLLGIRNQAHDRLPEAAERAASEAGSVEIDSQFNSNSDAEQSDNAEQQPSLPVFIISTPNIAFAAVRINLLLGRFNYAERGILDITHKRLFTRKSLLQMLRDCGYEIERVRGVGVPFAAVMPGRTGKYLGWIANLFAKIWPSLFAFQLLVECRPRPGVKDVLRTAIRIHELSQVKYGETIEAAQAEKR